MKYSNKQIKRLLRIKEFVEMSDTLARVYKDFENKDYFISTFTDRERIYRMYCSSIYNLIKAIEESKEFFEKSEYYTSFEKMIETKYVANDNKYYNKDNYIATFFKILETIRHQVNHFTKDDDDNNILFEVYIDFELIEIVRETINTIFYEVYNTIDKKKIKEIVLSKPRIQYSFDKINNKMDEFKIKMDESNNKYNSIFKEENDRAYFLFNQLFNGSNLYDLLAKDSTVIKKFESADREIKESFKKAEEYINEHGSELEKESLKLYKEFMEKKCDGSIKQTEDNIKELQERLEKLKERYNI